MIVRHRHAYASLDACTGSFARRADRLTDAGWRALPAMLRWAIAFRG